MLTILAEAEATMHAIEETDQAMRYVAYAMHPASSEATREGALISAIDSAIRAGAYRAAARGEHGRTERFIGAIHKAA